MFRFRLEWQQRLAIGLRKLRISWKLAISKSKSNLLCEPINEYGSSHKNLSTNHMLMYVVNVTDVMSLMSFIMSLMSYPSHVVSAKSAFETPTCSKYLSSAPNQNDENHYQFLFQLQRMQRHALFQNCGFLFQNGSHWNVKKNVHSCRQQIASGWPGAPHAWEKCEGRLWWQLRAALR